MDAQDETATGTDLSTTWQNWKEYVAFHKDGAELVGPGIVAVTDQLIEGTSDPNRFGVPRFDFVLHHRGGGYVWIHPGTKARQRFHRVIEGIAWKVPCNTGASEHSAHTPEAARYGDGAEPGNGVPRLHGLQPRSSSLLRCRWMGESEQRPACDEQGTW